MSPHIDVESLEDLAANRPVANSAIVTAHLAACAECREELAWIRSERAAFEARERQPEALDELWAAVAQKIAQPAQSAAPYRAPAHALIVPVPRRTTGRWWWVAAATFALVSSAAIAWVGVDRARSAGARAAEARVLGVVTLRVRTSSAEVRVEAGDRDRVRVVSEDRRAALRLVSLDARTYELRFDGPTPRGRVRVEVPRGTNVDVMTSSGDVTIGAIAGDAKVLTSSGEVSIAEVAALDVTTTSGDVSVRSSRGRVSVRTSSGDIAVAHPSDAVETLLTSTSGSVQWSGSCASACRMHVRSNSGDVRLAFDRASAATVRWETSSGRLRDAIDSFALAEQPAILRRIGLGSGAVQVDTTSGDLQLDRAR